VAAGTVTFTSIFPGCYTGRRPHIHFEVHSPPAAATSASGPIRKQIALPEAVTRTVHSSATGYSRSVTNMSPADTRR
jgi:protocatechuate 3,4-dioxygenase beta subunit